MHVPLSACDAIAAASPAWPRRLCAALGSLSVPIVRVLIVLFYVVAKPVSMVLDLALGTENATYYSKEEVGRGCAECGGVCWVCGLFRGGFLTGCG